MKKKLLFYFTTYYPFGFAEQFIENEINSLSKYYHKIYLIPLIRESKNHDKKLPQNVEIIQFEAPFEQRKSKDLLKDIATVCKISSSEIFRKGGFKRLLHFKTLLIEINQSLELGKYIQRIENDFTSFEISYYSTWMNQWSLALSILYSKSKIRNFTFKMRGFDLFNERRKDNFMPFRNFIFKNSSCRLSMSKEGVDYLNKKGFKNVRCNYPGIQMNRIFSGDFDGENIIVSCSNLVGLKRVDLIAKSVAQVKSNVRWIHFGDGPEMQNIQMLLEKMPPNVKVELRGKVKNEEIIQFYGTTPVNLFIHLSTTEGFGYSIVEAFSFGIPAVLYPGGAVKELIDPRFCTQVNESDSEVEIARHIESAFEKFKLTPQFRQEIVNTCESKFNVLQQGKELFDFIVSNSTNSN